jgi:hypothetical protein
MGKGPVFATLDKSLGNSRHYITLRYTLPGCKSQTSATPTASASDGLGCFYPGAQAQQAQLLRLSKSKGQHPPDIPVFLRALAVTEPVVVWDEAPAR